MPGDNRVSRVQVRQTAWLLVGIVAIGCAPAAKPPAARRTVPAIAHEHRTTTKGAVEVIHADGLWRVVWDGDPDADSTHESRITAIVVAHERAREARCELVIRTRDGTTREHVTYRDDPTEQRVIYREPRLRRA